MDTQQMTGSRKNNARTVLKTDAQGRRLCRGCIEWLDPSEFPLWPPSRAKGRRVVDPLQPYCCTCKRNRVKGSPELRARFRAERERVLGHELYERKKQQIYAGRRNETPEQRRRRLLNNKMRPYGKTVDDYEQILVEQGGGCACGAVESNGVSVYLHADHDHVSGEFRGLLCTNCNLALGLVDDDPDRLIRLAEYLRRHTSNT